MRTPRTHLTIAFIVGILGASVGGVTAADRLVPSQYATIQAAIDACNDGDVVIVAARDNNDPYTGDGFRDLDFSHNLPSGQTRAITVRSEAGPGSCKIDCQGDQYNQRRAFYFHSGETSASIVEGFTITAAYGTGGGAILCDGSSPKIVNCAFQSNNAAPANQVGGGAIACIGGSSPIISHCNMSSNEALRQPYQFDLNL